MKLPRLSPRPLRVLASLGAIAITAGNLHAVDYTSTVTSGSASWITDTNWTPAGIPNADVDTATISSLTASGTLSLDAAITVNQLTINNTAGTATIVNGTGGSLTFAGTTPTLTVSSGATFGTATSGSGLLTISGTSGLTKSGTTSINFTNVNGTGLTGQLKLTQGTINITGTLATLKQLGADGVGNELVVSNLAGVTIQNTTGTISKSMILNGNRTTSNGLDGAFQLYNGNVILSGNISVGSSAVISSRPGPNSAKTITINNGIAEAGTASDLSFVSKLDGGTANQNATYALNGQSTYGGNTYITSGTNAASAIVSLGVNNALPTTTVVTLGGGGATVLNTVVGNGRIQLNQFSQTVAGLTTVGAGTNNRVVGGNAVAGTLIVNDATDRTYAGFLGGTGTNENNFNVVKSGVGAWTLTRANTYLGTTTVDGGKLIVGNGAALGQGTVTVNSGGTLDFNGNFSLTLAGLVLNTGGTLVLDQDLTFAGLMIGGTSLAEGAYTYDFLKTNYDAFFASGGSGSITVVPEPSIVALIGVGLAVTFLRRRS